MRLAHAGRELDGDLMGASMPATDGTALPTDRAARPSGAFALFSAVLRVAPPSTSGIRIAAADRPAGRH